MGKIIASDAIDTSYHLGNNDGSIIFERAQDCAPVLDDVEKIRQVTNGKSLSGDMVHVGRIPAIVIEKYCNEMGVSFHEFCVDDLHVTKIMNDPDYKKFRIWEGRA